MDKGARELWGFCAAWVWDQVQQFMREEIFQRVRSSPQSWERHISQAVTRSHLRRNQQGRLCVPYLLSKAKSLATGQWVWRGICASPSPVLDKQQWRLGARALTMPPRTFTFSQRCLKQRFGVLNGDGDPISKLGQKDKRMKGSTVCSGVRICVVFTQALYWGLCSLTDVNCSRAQVDADINYEVWRGDVQVLAPGVCCSAR